MAIQTSASTASVIRPEFQLCQITNPKGYLVKQTDVFMPAGTIYARLYFPKGCTPVGGKVRGKKVFDSRVGRYNNSSFEIWIVCSEFSEYVKLWNGCSRSNIHANITRTRNFLRDMKANGIGTRSNLIFNFTPKPESAAKSGALVRLVFLTSALAVPSISIPATFNEVIAMALPTHLDVAPVEVAQPTPIAKTPIVVPVEPTPDQLVVSASDYAFIRKYAVRTLRSRICKRFGIIHSHITDADIKAYTIEQLIKHNIQPAAVRSIFK